ncbi:MAG: CoA ester lyase [Dehalococcoidia bacterium]|nr:CoA ester lyase [Dehalococcoidia bacterium]
MDLLRSLLFVPGNRADMIEKARTAPADALVLDMEDSVPLTEKATARAVVTRLVPGLALRNQMVFVRVNGLCTGLTEEDIAAVVLKGVDGLSLPKAESPEDIIRADALIRAAEIKQGIEPGTIRLIPWIETARGVMYAYEILSASPRLIGVAFGADDFTRDMGVERTKEAMEQFFPRASIGLAARVAGVLALDTPYVDIKDEEGLIRDTGRARLLGFKGRFCIHPRQIDAVNKVYTPSPEEIDSARKTVAAFDAASAQGKGAIQYQGQMVDTAGVERLRKFLALADELSKKQAG